MPTPEKSDSPSITRPTTPAWKIALVPILAIVLVWNLASPSTRTLDATIAEPSDPEDATIKTTGPHLAAAPFELPQPQLKTWPTLDADTIAGFDPFALSGALAQRSIVVAPTHRVKEHVAESEATREKTQLEEAARQLNVQGIFKGSSGVAALVDSRIVRIGDEIEPGLRIVQITPTGIVEDGRDALRR